MKTNFTPGPWQSHVVYDDLGGSSFGIYTNHSGDGYGDHIQCIDEDDTGESQANARLIAAAPELLEALVQISIASSDGELSLHDQWVIRTCQSAIAKALGE